MPPGNAGDEEFRVNDQRINSQFEPDIAALDTGGFVIAWTDNNSTDGSGQGVFAQQYNADGNRLDSQFQVNTTTSGTQNQPAVEGLPGGGFVVSWNGSVLIQVYGNEAPRSRRSRPRATRTPPSCSMRRSSMRASTTRTATPCRKSGSRLSPMAC